MIHVFSYKDKNYIYDSGSGSLHECDAQTAAYVAYYYENKGEKPEFTAEKIAEIEKDVNDLKAQEIGRAHVRTPVTH